MPILLATAFRRISKRLSGGIALLPSQEMQEHRVIWDLPIRETNSITSLEKNDF
jgi:hypothetical protein